MKVLLVALGSAGDVHPLVGVGAAIKARGHRVVVVTNPHFASLVERVGLEFLPIGTSDELHAAMANPDLWHPRRGFSLVVKQLMLPLMRPLYEIIAEHYEPPSTIVAAPCTALGARLVQDKLGVPLATLHLQPAMLRSHFQSSRLPPMAMGDWVPGWLKAAQFWALDALIDRMVGPDVNAFRAELGLAPVRRRLALWWDSPQRVIGLFPEWFASPQPDWPEQAVLTGFPLYDESGATEPPADLTRFLEEGSPPLVFTPGSAMLHGREFFQGAIEACGRLGQRGILLTRYAEQIPSGLPPGMMHFDFVPFSRLLPHCRALVHHGGIGTCSQGLAAGVPQLVMAMNHDQPDNAARLVKLGVAAQIRPRGFRGAAVAGALSGLISSPHVQSRCRELAATFDTPRALAATCEYLEQLCPVSARAASVKS